MADIQLNLKCIDKNNNKIDTPIAIFNSTKYGEIAKIGDSDGIVTGKQIGRAHV